LINNFITKTAAGLYCATGNFYIDPNRAVSKALVSHAHGDHAVATRGNVFCSSPTKSFMLLRQKSTPEFNVVEFKVPFFINEVKITFFPAGHMLGSAQILMEHKGERYLYTGDFKTQPDESCERFEFVECDHLITETTFASPEYEHPDPVTEIQKITEGQSRIIIGAYVLGKAQRLTQLISKNFPQTIVYIHPDIEVYHMLYEEHGYSAGNWKPFRRSDFNKGMNSVYIVPPAYFRRFVTEKNVLKVFATGWKKSKYKCDKILHVSDHADWSEVLELITRSKAKKVYTVHGNGTFLKEHLKDSVEVKIIG